ncbi:hypothetical protein NPX13_g5158 [Xylaria arbuscula]|uniref:tRNA(Phe) 7-[(3-amino-3-carboxypropyl)-4-demethylwyosine(37)-N(4)]-methyltransferase n=1 Tax=Xylaria arbuscula TaxID=114810 RepID=A0A9W8TMY9_9PEZI|nr:hypothetical protein NPX13_g5158 [Xylaria arbuscula]
MRGSSVLPPPPPNFSLKKECILGQLAVPDAEYNDASPKGSVDAGIRDLIGEINAIDGFVTTSSCAGRVSVFVEGRKSRNYEGLEEEGGTRPATVAAVGGKGGGGTWLFVSHDPVKDDATRCAKSMLGLEDSIKSDGRRDAPEGCPKDTRLIHFKFEPMILHVLTASLEHAQLILRWGLQAGFRESGAINLIATGADAVTPMVAIRSMGLSLESLIGMQEDGVTKCTVSDDYLLSLLRIANERFGENKRRIERFRANVLEASNPPTKRDGTEWEDAQARRERKRNEGLLRRAELKKQSKAKDTSEGGENADLDIMMTPGFT